MHDVRLFLRAPFDEPGELLYVGYRRDACSWLEELHEAGNRITVLEKWPANVTADLDDPRVSRFWVGDVRSVEQVYGLFNHIWWWHGPEHIAKAEFPGVLLKMVFKAKRCVAVAAPWGRYEQGPAYGNPHEQHMWSVYEQDLQAVGMETRTDGVMDEPGSEVVGWVTT
jgi:hypothetical protein